MGIESAELDRFVPRQWAHLVRGPYPSREPAPAWKYRFTGAIESTCVPFADIDMVASTSRLASKRRVE